jgi:TRAP-type mannitol/chloroaromatic compound transport system permease small subunit
MRRYCIIIGKINLFLGTVLQWTILPISAIVMFEVIARYVFNRPTIWAWDVNVQLLALMATLGGGYVLLNDDHVRVDILVAKFSSRKRAILDSFTGLLTIVALGVLTWHLSEEAITSVKYLEVHWSYWAPPVYPLRVLMAFGSLMLLLQAIAVFLQNISRSLGHEQAPEVEPK